MPPPPEAPELPASAVPAAPPDTSEEEVPAAAVQPVATVPSDVFPHAEHRSVRCATCHTSVPGHSSHMGVECTACHQVPEEYATLPVRTEEDCLACHHAPERATPCITCHGTEAGGMVTVTATLDLSAATPPAERTLTFPHERHADLDCGTCHTSGIHFEVERTCASCHEPHHRAEAECLTCHEPAQDRHELQSHLGCAGSTCHDRPDIDELPEVRSVCLTCHAEQRSHEEGLPCVQCHVTGRNGGAP